jgi:signal transduction histidine kinase/CheY-like chemotaxis protein
VLHFLRKINIATQLTFLVALVAGLAIYIVSRAAENTGSELVLERQLGALGDEAELRSLRLREAHRLLGRDLRAAAPGMTAETPAVLDRLGQDDGDLITPEVYLEARLLEAHSPDDIRSVRVFRRQGGKWQTVPAGGAPGPAVEEVRRLIRNHLRAAGPDVRIAGQFQTGLVRVAESAGPQKAAYHMGLAYPVRLGRGLPVQLLAMTVDFTRLVHHQARRHPRQMLVMLDADGRCVYHPDPTLVGQPDDLWGVASTAEAEELARRSDFRGERLASRVLPQLEYYVIRKPLAPALTDSRESCRTLEEQLDIPGLFFSRVYRGVPMLVLGSRDQAVLTQARTRIEQREREVLGHAGEWPATIDCRTFVGYYLGRVSLDLLGQVSADFILASSEEEIAAAVSRATRRLWYRWYLPVILATIVLAWLAAHVLTRSLKRLTEAAQRIAQGDHAFRIRRVGPGEVGKLAGAFADMADRIRQRERDLRENLARMNTILTTAADGIITFDPTGRIEQANDAAEQMFGYAGGLRGVKIQKLLNLPGAAAGSFSPAHIGTGIDSKGPAGTAPGPSAGSMMRIADAVKTAGEDLVGVRGDGSSFWLEVTFSRVPVEDRHLVTGIFRDVTQRKLAEERIRQMNDELEARVRLRTAQLQDAKSKLEVALRDAESANASKDRFISVVSHELRTPLTSAMGYTELLLNPRAARLRENPTPTLQKVLTACKHLQTLINDLLDVGRYTAGKPIDLSPARFDLNVFVRGVIEMISPLVKKNSNHLETSIPDNLGEIFNDETRLRQILLNLLSNACKFTENGTITLGVELLDAQGRPSVRFVISDTGAGMTEAELEKLFTPFYRVDNSQTRKQGGTGLGLTITRMLCTLMGGDIEVKSAPGQGSTFTVTLPAEVQVTAPSAPGERETASLPGSERGVVLVVDDDATCRQMLETYLQHEGYKVVGAGTGNEGLRLARELLPSCITLDVVLPDQDGWSVLAALKKDDNTRGIPVVMLTIMEDRHRALALGAMDYVTKPIDWDRLSGILRRFHPAQST